MAFISVSEEVAKKSFTSIENKFITKYLPVLEPMAVKVYIYSLYIFQSGNSLFTLTDFAESLNISEEQAKGYFEYLEEFELVSIISSSPFEIKILDAENVYGTPKKFKPEKYGEFTKAVQNIIKGRMISTNEFREYFYLIEEYGFEQNALLMLITYCVNLKGEDIRLAYIKKVAQTFANDGITTAKKVEEKLSAYTFTTPALIRLFTASGIKKQPDLDDDKLYKKWTDELGFDDDAIIAAAKLFKAKNVEKLDESLSELYKNKKFDKLEIEDYCKTKNSVYALAAEIARNLGVYMQTAAPYVDNYVNVWCNYGYSFESLKTLASYCFKNGKNSFEDMNSFISELYDEGIVADISVAEYLKEKTTEDKILKEILSACGLSRKVINWDREALSRWRSWNFSDNMIFEAAKISAGKSNPMAYMNGVLSTWKTEGITSPDKISRVPSAAKTNATPSRSEKAEIERHYSELRQIAETRAEKIFKKATDDGVYNELRKQLNELNIKLAFAEIRDKKLADELNEKIKQTEIKAQTRLNELGIDKSDFVPKYSCSICGDTGYDKNGNPCVCLNEFLKSRR